MESGMRKQVLLQIEIQLHLQVPVIIETTMITCSSRTGPIPHSRGVGVEEEAKRRHRAHDRRPTIQAGDAPPHNQEARVVVLEEAPHKLNSLLSQEMRAEGATQKRKPLYWKT